MSIYATICYALLALATVLFLWVKRRYSYWKDRGIPHDKPKFPEGNLRATSDNQHPRDLIKNYYDKYKGTGPFAGMYLFLSPMVLVLDLDLARDILIKDFYNFAERGFYYNEVDDPLSAHLFAMDGPKWKSLRSKLSPTFTSGKMKLMFPTMVAVGEQLVEVLAEEVTKADKVVEIKDILARFSTDVIGTCAFGIDCNSLKDPDAEFRVVGAKVFKQTRHHQIIEGLMMCFPKLARKLRMRVIHEEIHQFFMRVVRETVEYREKNSIKRNDFMNLLLELKNSEDGLTIEEIAAQVFIFFFAGFDTSSAAMGFTLFELSLNQEIQDKLRNEINETFKKHGGKFTYECMADMHYMDKVVKETLRKYPVNPNLIRKCVKDYPTRDPKYTIEKGLWVFIEVDAIQRDPEIFPDPEKFDPERFNPGEDEKRHPAAYLPFGDGPRNCIGLRFGKMQMFVGLALLLKNFKFHFSERTSVPLELEEKKPLLALKGGLYLQVERVQN